MVKIMIAILLAGLSIWVFMKPINPRQTPLRRIFKTESRNKLQRSAKDTARETEDYAKAIRQLASLLSSGSSNTTAFEILERIWNQTTEQPGKDIHTACLRALTQVRTGGTIQEGLSTHSIDNKHASRLWKQLAWCFAISERSGAALAELLDQLATDLENSADMRRALDTALAGPRATSRLLTFLPLIGLGLGQLLGIEPVHVLFSHPLGRIALVSGVLLWVSNRWWCNHMLGKIVTRAPA